MAKRQDRPQKKPTGRKKQQAIQPLAGSVVPGEVMTKTEFMRRMNLSRSAYLALVRDGLPRRQMGKQSIILGDEFAEFAKRMKRKSNAEAAKAGSQSKRRRTG